jgi:hypothetical protein
LFFDLSGELIEAIGSSSLIIIYIIAILDTRSTLATAHAVRLAAKKGRKEGRKEGRIQWSNSSCSTT